MEIKLTIDATPNLAALLKSLAAALMGPTTPPFAANAFSPTAPEQPVPPMLPHAAQPHTQQPATTGAPPTLPPIPTSAPSYKLETLMSAAAALADAGKRDQVLALLPKYSIQALTGLQPDQFGAFALDLKALGAKL